jgi:hypothetical protein
MVICETVFIKVIFCNVLFVAAIKIRNNPSNQKNKSKGSGILLRQGSQFFFVYCHEFEMKSTISKSFNHRLVQ